MPAHSYMLNDLLASAAAVCLFAFLVVLPGYAMAHLSDLFEFRRRTLAFQLALSIPLSIAICPAVTYFAWRFGSIAAVWVFNAAAAVYALASLTRRRVSLAPYTRVVTAIAGAWTAIAIFSLIDLQIGRHAWYPSAAFDYAVRTQFIHAIGVTGIPPANPFFRPGHAVALRYHYFWLILCALVDLAGGSLITARHAWIAGTVWCGIGLMASVVLFLRLFFDRGSTLFRRRAVLGVLLLSVTGLDIVPQAMLWMLQLAGMHAVRPAMEWWNEQVDGFVYSVLWESHYIAGLIACLMAFLILWVAPCRDGRRARAKQVVLAGIALATGFGCAIYVALVFGIFLGVWTAFVFLRRRWREGAVLSASGAAALLLALPFALSLRGPAQGGQLLEFWIRPFSPIDGLFRGQGLDKGLTLPLVNAVSLPLNYFLELGFFFAAAVLWWSNHRTRGKHLTRAESATWTMIATSVTICTFLRSSVIGNNDLGWRGFLIAQFGLLLIAVDVLSQMPVRRTLLGVLLVLGVAGSAYEVGINRFYAPLADGGVVPIFSWLAPDRHAGARNFAVREAGEWLMAATRADSIVQFNPRIADQNTSALLYSERPSLAANQSCMSTFGGDPALCPGVMDEWRGVFPPAGQPATADLASVCRATPAVFVAAVDTDSVWTDRRSWVWSAAPAFANKHVRVFRCR